MGKCWIISWMAYRGCRIFRCASTLKDKPQLFWLIIIFRCCLIAEAISGSIILVIEIGIQERALGTESSSGLRENSEMSEYSNYSHVLWLRTMDNTQLYINVKNLEKWKIVYKISSCERFSITYTLKKTESRKIKTFFCLQCFNTLSVINFSCRHGRENWNNWI